MNVNNGIENQNQILPSQTRATTAVANAAPATVHASSNQPSQVLAEDKAQLSNAAKQVAQSAAAPEVRMDKVASIQSALEAGTYQVPASDVAKKVIASMLDTEK
jgi:flagellar biosynthesis anti-sigma factor FlgM